MLDAGRPDGDVLVAQKKSPNTSSDVVVAVVDGEIAPKYLRRARGRHFPKVVDTAYGDIKSQR
jgi:SOS-response transcriptional repressor LexA